MAKARIPARPARSVDELVALFGDEEGLVDAFLANRITDADIHVISPTWLTCYLLRRTLATLEKIHAALVGRPPRRPSRRRRS